MDESRKAASVGQLKELVDSLDERFKALEKKSEPKTPDVGSMMLGVQQTLEAKMGEASSSVKTELLTEMRKLFSETLTAAIAELAAQNQQMFLAMTEMLSRPLTRTGTATLPNGETIQLRVAESKM